jgi:PAS domain S-box-containing protein
MVRDEQGKPRFAIGMLEDIEQQRSLYETIRESEARFRTLFDNASVGIALMTLDRHILSINQSTQHIIGYSVDELLDIDPTSLSHPEDRAIGMEQYQAMIAGEINGFTMEKRYICKDNRVIWARITYSVVRGEEGKPEYVIGMIEDITEQYEARQKLEKQEREYREQLEQRVMERTVELSKANKALQKEIGQRERAEEALAARAAEEAVLAERTRLARDLHDAVTQTLFSASLIAEVLPDLWEMDAVEARKSTDELRQLTRGALAEMRTLLLELRPAALTQARFEDLLRQLVEGLIGRARLPIALKINGEGRLPADVQVALYRISQESLNNVVKYARATQVQIRLELSSCKARLEIADNGIGFDPTTLKPGSLGMRIMRERAEAVSAIFRLTSSPGKGTVVVVDWEEKGKVGKA